MKKLLAAVEKKYRLKIHNYKTIHDTEKTRVLTIQTNKGKYILKTLFKPIERQLFILEAEEHLRNNKIKIPNTLGTKNKQPYFIWKDHPYILQKWIPGSPYPLNNAEKIKKVASLLGKIHRSSLGFHSKKGNQYNGSLSWKTTYEDSLLYLKDWKSKHRNNSDENIKALVKNIDFFSEIGQRVYESCMENSYFHQWINLPLKKHYLCHGDFHTNNLLVKGNRFSIIDWEDVRYDFPSKDFIRILSFMMMKRYPDWDRQRFEMMFSNYLKKNPLTKQEKGLFFHDMAFPHIFVRHLKKELYKGMSLSKVEQFIQAERDKAKYMFNQMRTYIPLQ